MDMIFFLLAFISLIALLIGLFSPEKSLFWWGGERTRMLSAKVYATSFGVCFLIFIWYMPKNQTALETARTAPDTTTKQVEKVADVDTSTIKMPEGVKKFAKELKEKAKNAPQETSQSLTYIPGLTAVDVYLNFTNKGFSKSVSSADGNVSYFCEQKGEDYSLILDILGEAHDKINRIRGTVMQYSSTDNDDTRNFLPYLSSVTYKNARPQEARNWVTANLGQNTSTNIAGVTFTLSNSGQGAKMLTIEPAP